MDKKDGLTAVVIAKNEERLIEGCLRSLAFCDEIVVIIDATSEDATEEIVRRYTKKVFSRLLEDFASQKNFGIEQASHSWILIVDADERVAPELQEQIKLAIKQSDAAAYDIPTKPYLFGIEIKHSGWAPSYHTRLFRQDARYQGVVHEVIETSGAPTQLSGALIHYNYNDIQHFLAKLNQYTNLEAVKLRQSGKPFKPRYVVTGPLREIAFRYIKKEGFRDGFIGIALAGLMGCYRLVSTLKWWELERNQDIQQAYLENDRKVFGEQ